MTCSCGIVYGGNGPAEEKCDSNCNNDRYQWCGGRSSNSVK